MKAYKVELLVIDHENRSAEDIAYELTNTKYANASLMKMTAADIGEWHDDHPLNKWSTQKAEFARLFP